MEPQAPALSKLIHAVHGAKVRIEAVVLDDGSCPAEEFLDQLSESETAKIQGLFDLFVRTFPENLSDQKFKRIVGTVLFEFKCFQIRMPCFFFPGGRVLLTYGLRKKTDNLRPRDIRKAQDIKSVFERRVKSHG